MLAKVGDFYLNRAGGPRLATGLDFGVSSVPETYLIGAGGRFITKVCPVRRADQSAEALLESGGWRAVELPAALGHGVNHRR